MDVFDRLVDQAAGPDGDRVFVELVYATLLGRRVEPEVLDVVSAQLREGTLARSAYLRSVLESTEYMESALIEEILTGISPGAFTVEEPLWPGTSERVVEIPWALSRVPREGRVLDIGYAFAAPAYLRALMRIAVDVHGVDVVTGGTAAISRVQADVRDLPYEDESFEAILCISTLEHVGRDNSRYGIASTPDPEGDLKTLLEAGRVLAPCGVLLVTVPFGRSEDHGWFVQYDQATWVSLVELSGLQPKEQDCFRLTEEGWMRADADDMKDLRYGQGAPGARGILCASLVRER